MQRYRKNPDCQLGSFSLTLTERSCSALPVSDGQASLMKVHVQECTFQPHVNHKATAHDADADARCSAQQACLQPAFFNSSRVRRSHDPSACPIAGQACVPSTPCPLFWTCLLELCTTPHLLSAVQHHDACMESCCSWTPDAGPPRSANPYTSFAEAIMWGQVTERLTAGAQEAMHARAVALDR